MFPFKLILNAFSDDINHHFPLECDYPFPRVGKGVRG